MRTVKLNVLEEQVKWLKEHSKNGCTFVCDSEGIPTQAVYTSPLEQWKGLMDPDGTVNVPDMDYYNSVTSITEMREVIDELGSLYSEKPPMS
jgi:hypothetical protein